MKITCVVGTRPEFIKMFPVVGELRRRGESPIIIATGQHTDLLRGTPFDDGMAPDVNLKLPGTNDPFQYTAICEGALRTKWVRDKPELVIVQGDTASAYAGAIAAATLEIPVAHVEAGVRSGDIDDPFPEEQFRISIDEVSSRQFAPTHHCMLNLRSEPLDQYNADLVGNPGIDALYSHTQPVAQSQKVDRVLITLHRRESFGDSLFHMTSGVLQAAKRYPPIQFEWPVHPNPKVLQGTAWAFASDGAGVHPPPNLVDVFPMPTVEFAHALATSRAVITDSGGVQEEACALGIPCVVAREKTDRPESVELGLARVAGRTEAGILEGLAWALDAKIEPSDCFGDGKAAPRIVEHLLG